MQSLKVYAILLPVFLLVDLFWLGIVMKQFYSDELGELARRSGGSLSPRWSATVLVYALIPAGLVVFVKPMLGADATVWNAAFWGAAFGFVMYGVYDLTNLAVLDKWTTRMTIVDMAWGTVLCGAASVFMWFVDRWPSR